MRNFDSYCQNVYRMEH